MLSLEICCWSHVTSSITTSWSEKIWDECLLLVLANERWSTCSRARFESGRLHDRSCVTFLCEPVKQNVHLPWFFSRELFLWNSRCVWSYTCFQPKTAVCSSKHRRTNFHFSQCLVHRWCLAMDDHKIASLSQKEILSHMGTHRITTYWKSNQRIHFSAVSPAQDLRLLCAERIWFSKQKHFWSGSSDVHWVLSICLACPPRTLEDRIRCPSILGLGDYQEASQIQSITNLEQLYCL